MRTVVRPIQSWPDPPTRRRERSRFDSGYESTKALLERECRHLGAREVVIQLAVPESDIRIDGTYPKANARIEHPGVIVSFESKHGPLRYSTDRFTHWLDNLRAIALGLAAQDRPGADGPEHRPDRRRRPPARRRPGADRPRRRPDRAGASLLHVRLPGHLGSSATAAASGDARWAGVSSCAPLRSMSPT